MSEQQTTSKATQQQQQQQQQATASATANKEQTTTTAGTATASVRRIRVETIAKHIAAEWSQHKYNHNKGKPNPLAAASWLSNTFHHAILQCAKNGYEVVFEFEDKLFKVDRSSIYDARPKKSLVASHSYNVFTSRALFPIANQLFACLDYMIKEFPNKERSDNKEHTLVMPGVSRLSTETHDVSKSDAVANTDLNGKKADIETQIQHFYTFYCQPIAKYVVSSKVPIAKIKEDLLKEKCPEPLAVEVCDSIEFCRNNAGTNKTLQTLYEQRFKFQEDMVKSFDDEKKLTLLAMKE